MPSGSGAPPVSPGSDVHPLDSLLAEADQLRSSGAHPAAAILLRKLVLLAPERLDIRLLLGDTLHRLGRYDEALSVYDEASSRFPDSPLLANNRGVTLLARGDLAEAVTTLARAIILDPTLAPPRATLSTALMRLGAVDEALSICDDLLTLHPDDPQAHWNRALLLLLKGNYREGFAEYEWRWKRPDFTSPKRYPDRPLLDRLPVSGRTILVHGEQGFGDTIQFSRYLPLLVSMGNRVIFQCHPELVRLMQRLYPHLEVIPFDAAATFDLHIPLMSLPHRLGTASDAHIPPIPVPPPPRPSTSPLRVGICWRGKGYPDPDRSIDEPALAPLSTMVGVAWYSLTVGAPPLPWMIDPTPHLRDFADTADLLERLDLVLSIDSAVAHLAGTLGKPVLLLLPPAADWRWLLGRSDSPWYPTMKILRRGRGEGWERVIEEAGGEIARFRDRSAGSGEVSSRS